MPRGNAVRVGTTLFLLLGVAEVGRTRDDTIRVSVSVDPNFDFAEVETYQWHPDQRVTTDLEHHGNVVRTVYERMSAYGFRVDVREPELLIEYSARFGKTEITMPREEIQPIEDCRGDCEDAFWRYVIVSGMRELDDDDKTIESLELTMTLIDAETNWEVYTASGEFPWSGSEAERILGQAVRQLLARVPRDGGGP